MGKIIGIVGSRRRNSQLDYLAVHYEFFEIYKTGDQICSGGCPKGADSFAERIAEKFNIPIMIVRANWDKFGKSAGFVRNGIIAEKSDVLIACVASDRKGGTEDTILKFVKKLRRRGKLIMC